MPKLWADTVAEHRSEVREAIMDTTWALAEERGLLAVSMSQIAERVGIGRATLYKYFPDVETILLAYHRRHVAEHLAQLDALRHGRGSPARRLEAVLTTFARITHHRRELGTAELSAVLHRGEHVDVAQRQVRDLLRDLLAEVVEAGGPVRHDIAATELATFCMHAVAAAGDARSEAALSRVVTLTLAAVRPET